MGLTQLSQPNVFRSSIWCIKFDTPSARHYRLLTPILREYGIRAMACIQVNNLTLSEVATGEELNMSHDDLRWLADNQDVWLIGSHSSQHKHLIYHPALPDDTYLPGITQESWDAGEWDTNAGAPCRLLRCETDPLGGYQAGTAEAYAALQAWTPAATDLGSLEYEIAYPKKVIEGIIGNGFVLEAFGAPYHGLSLFGADLLRQYGYKYASGALADTRFVPTSGGDRGIGTNSESNTLTSIPQVQTVPLQGFYASTPVWAKQYGFCCMSVLVAPDDTHDLTYDIDVLDHNVKQMDAVGCVTVHTVYAGDEADLPVGHADYGISEAHFRAWLDYALENGMVVMPYETVAQMIANPSLYPYNRPGVNLAHNGHFRWTQYYISSTTPENIIVAGSPKVYVYHPPTEAGAPTSEVDGLPCGWIDFGPSADSSGGYTPDVYYKSGTRTPISRPGFYRVRFRIRRGNCDRGLNLLANWGSLQAERDVASRGTGIRKIWTHAALAALGYAADWIPLEFDVEWPGGIEPNLLLKFFVSATGVAPFTDYHSLCDIQITRITKERNSSV